MELHILLKLRVIEVPKELNMSVFSELNPTIWLTNLLSRKNCERVSPTGEPLYSYQVTQDEYESLKQILQTFGKNFDLLKRNQTLCALFVMYCAEWWRRSFQGGAWSWSALLAEIEVDELEVNKPTIYEVCEKGLFFWKRKVLSSNAGRREFLGTFAAEGGLPINQLNAPNNWIERVLKTALKEYLRFGTDISQIIEQRFKVVNVPATFKDANSSLKETLAGIVEVVYQLNIEYKLAEQTHPESYLNDVEPNWRDQFPIPLDSEQGRLLLEALIKNASQTISKRGEQNAVFRLNRVARIVDGELMFEASVEILSKLLLDSNLTNQVKSFADNNPIAIDIEVHLPNQQKQVIARGRLTSNVDDEVFEYQLQSIGKLSIKESLIATSAFGLFLRLRNQERVPYPLDSASELDFSEPMIFESTLANREELGHRQCLKLLGFAESLSVKEESALLFVPNCSQPLDTSETQFYFPKFDLKLGKLVEFSGQLSVKTDAHYRFKTKHSGSAYQFELNGQYVEYAKNPSVIFKGFPQVFQINTETGFRTSIHSNGLKVRVRPYGENAPWQIQSADIKGQYEIAVFDQDNSILFKRRIGILPKNADITLMPGEDVSHGQVTISGIVGDFALDSSVFVVKQVQNLDGRSVDFRSEKSIPNENFELFLKLLNRSKSLVFCLPFPSLGARLFSPEGDALSSPVHTLFLDQLHGYRLKVFRTQQREISITFQLKDVEQDFEIERRFRFGDNKTRLMTFNLLDWDDEIRKLLKHGESIDAHVVIEMSMNHQRLCKLVVRNYLNELESDNDGQLLLLKGASLQDFESLDLEAFRLDAPEQKSVKLTQRIENGVLYPMWDTSPLYKKDADWMIQTQETDVHLRPILCSTHQYVEGFDTPDAVFSLKEVARISNRSQRLKAYDAVLTAMAEDLNHKDWTYFEDFFDRTVGQPIEAFDLYRTISKHSLFLASLCFQARFHGLLKLIQESLSVNWFLVHSTEWTVSYLAVRKSIEQKIEIEESDFIKSIMNQQIESLLDNGFKQIILSSIESVKSHLKGITSPITFNIFITVTNQDKNKLLQRCADEYYPQALSGTVNWYVENYKLHELQNNIQAGNPNWRLPVLMMPIILAHNAVHGSKIWLNSSQRYELQKIIDFDQEWFETAFNLAFGYFQYKKTEVAA